MDAGHRAARPSWPGCAGVWFSEGTPFVFSVVGGPPRGPAPRTCRRQRPSSVFERIGDDVYRTVQGRERGELLRVTRDDAGVPVKLNWATYLCTREPLAFGEDPLTPEPSLVRPL